MELSDLLVPWNEVITHPDKFCIMIFEKVSIKINKEKYMFTD